MRQKYFWPKLIATALLLHVVLILLSVLEVVIYSYLVNPGHGKEFYEAHATQSAPGISYIFGSLFTFLLVRRFVQRFTQQQLLYALALPLVYAVIDSIAFLMMTADGGAFVIQFVVGKVVKMLAGIMAYFVYAKNPRHEMTHGDAEN